MSGLKLKTVYRPDGKAVRVNGHMLGYIEVNENSRNYPHRLVGWTKTNPKGQAPKAQA